LSDAEVRRFSSEDILVTERLFSREARRPDLIAEAGAFQALSAALLIDAETAIERFVQLALDLCPSAGSAGLSELEHLDDGLTQFRWTALAGVFAPHVGGMTPRDNSPCGLCLDAHHAILVERPVRLFEYFEAVGTPIVEGLIVPLYDTRKAPLGTIWIVSHRDGLGFNATDVRVVEQLAVLLVLGLKLRNDETRISPRTAPAEAPDEASLLIQRIAQDRDRAAFAALFSAFAAKLKGFMLRRGLDDGQAEDCAQETLLTVWRKADQFDPHRASAAAWIYTIARNQHVDVLRHERRPDNGRLGEVTPNQITPEEALREAQGAQRVREAINTLPPEQAEVLRRSFYDEDSHAEIAAGLGLPLGTVKSRIRLAAAQLRSTLNGLA
jgi:RNA polymerase sigma-70 factor (ECF subfamily)